MKTVLYVLIIATMVLDSGTLRAQEHSQPAIADKMIEGRTMAVKPKGDTDSYKVTDLYTEGPGTNPPWQELIDKGRVIVGEERGKPIQGTTIDVNNALLESKLDGVEGTVRPDRIHTHVNSNIYNKTFDQWSRWYQEDGNTQIFRLIEGEQSVRSHSNIKAGRIEAVKSVLNPKPGTWAEWQGTYTIIKPGNGCIFQLFAEKNPETGEGGLWSLHLDQSPDGSIFMTRRRPKGDEEKKVLIAQNVIGKNVTVKVRFDGKTKYEVYRKIHSQDKDFVFVGAGTYHQHYGKRLEYRWGIYQGSKPGSRILQDCMLFVTGVKIGYSKAES
jgi:hypothetical protein